MIANHKGEVPVIVLLLPFLGGILAGLNLFATAGINTMVAAFAFLCIAFIFLNINYNKFRLYKYRWLGGTLIMIILFLFGWIIAGRHSELNSKHHFSKVPADYLIVKINNEPALKKSFFRFTAGVEESLDKGKQSATSGTLLISIKDSSAKNLYYGDELLIPAKYAAIDPPFNPAEFNYKQYLANKNIYYQAFLYPKQFVLLKTNAGNPLIASAYRLRQRLVEKLKRNIPDTAAAAVASTLILGYKADLSSDVLQAYSKTGTVYVLSVSGAQVAIIYLLLTYALGFLDRFKYGKLIKAVIIIPLIWYYAMLTGFSLAVCRAALMVSMVITGKTFSRYINTLNVLAISAFLLLCYNPYDINEVGFQLSYLAVFGLIVFRPVVYKLLKFKNKAADKLWALCSLSIAAQVIIFPLSIFYFHTFPVYFLVSNLFVIIPSALIMYTGIIFLLLPQIPVVSSALAFILEKTIILTDKGLSLIENAPFSAINKLWITTAEYLLMYVIIISLFYFLYDKKVWLLKLSMVCCLLLCLSFSVKSIRGSSSKSIAWLNLKRHRGIVFKNGNEAIVLSDLKNTDKSYQYSIQPYLDSCRVKNIQVFDLNADIDAPWLKKKLNLMQFLKTNIFIFDGRLQTNALSQKLNANYIYITENPKGGLAAINNNFACHTLIIDATNSDRLTTDWGKQLKLAHIDYKILKRNKSFISISN